MDKTGPIVIVEDDAEDQEFMANAISDLGITNELVFLKHGEEGLVYLRKVRELPMLILCDINLPVMDGILFKRHIDEDAVLSKRSILFVFFTTAPNDLGVSITYHKMNILGFFEKPSTYKELKNTIKIILDYWKHCWYPGQK